MLYHHHHNERPKQKKRNHIMYIPTQTIGLIPNLQNILFNNSDIIFLLHISDHIDHLEHTLKTLEIAKMFPNDIENFNHNQDDDMFEQEKESQIMNKTLIVMDSYQLEEFDEADIETEQQHVTNKGDLIFSPPPKIRMRKSHASTMLLNNIKNNIDTIPIESRRQISSMPLEILQLKKSKNNCNHTFLVPLGFSTYNAFIVKRENHDQNSLELHLKTNKSKFYVIIDNIEQFKDWVLSAIKINNESLIDAEFDTMQNEEHTEEEFDDELRYDYSLRYKPIFILSLLMNIICFLILGAIDYIDVEISFFEPFRESFNRISREFEIIHDRYHQHQYQYNEIISLYDELNTISNYCKVYMDSQTNNNQQNHLFEFCESIISVHQSCPVDLLSIVQ